MNTTLKYKVVIKRNCKSLLICNTCQEWEHDIGRRVKRERKTNILLWLSISVQDGGPLLFSTSFWFLFSFFGPYSKTAKPNGTCEKVKNEGKKEKEKKSEARLREIHAAAVAVPRIRNTLIHKIRNTLKLKKKKKNLLLFALLSNEEVP